MDIIMIRIHLKEWSALHVWKAYKSNGFKSFFEIKASNSEKKHFSMHIWRVISHRFKMLPIITIKLTFFCSVCALTREIIYIFFVVVALKFTFNIYNRNSGNTEEKVEMEEKKIYTKLCKLSNDMNCVFILVKFLWVMSS